MTAVGIDSMTYMRVGRTTFKAPLGVAVEVNDYASFKADYTRITTKLLAEHSISSKRKALKSYRIFSITDKKNADSFINSFADSIQQYVKMLYVCHSVIPPKKISQIYCYRGSKIITPIECINLLSSSYPHCIAWSFLKDFPNMSESSIFVDSFDGEETKAWEQIKSNPNLHIFPAGDECNALISTADLLTRYIDVTIRNKQSELGTKDLTAKFGSVGIQSCFENFHGLTIPKFLDTLSEITPDTSKSIDISAKLKHPCFFVVSSHYVKKEKEIIESTQLYDTLTNQAFDNDGCVKFFNLDETANELKKIKDGDIVVTVGDKAYETMEYLLNDVGLVNAKIIKSRDLLAR